ncbi:hypothetical protein NIES4101_43610 [Calothrix sp. NIES-4101]|nr:hypothetical protein NIES4101_43610 [Calothrix sp. NIES-4101]
MLNDAYTRGVEYLKMVQRLALQPEMVDVLEPTFTILSTTLRMSDREFTLQEYRISICNWIGQNIYTVNAQLNTYLQVCHECFHPQERRNIRIFAVPLSHSLGIDGFCNILINPTTILIDVGRVAPNDWLGIVAHEYAHAHLGLSGHNYQFANILCHLCLGLGLEPPTWETTTMESSLRSWPYCQSTTNPLAFWIGEA